MLQAWLSAYLSRGRYCSCVVQGPQGRQGLAEVLLKVVGRETQRQRKQTHDSAPALVMFMFAR